MVDAASAQATGTATVRVMSYNVLLGERWPAVRELIREHDPDVICLQEVPDERRRRPRHVPPSRIARELGLPNAWTILWSDTPWPIGNMTLVRGAIGPTRVLRVPLSKPYGMVNVIEVAGVRLTVSNIHMTEMLGPPPLAFPISEMFRLREAQDLTRRFARCRGPVIALGDFNTFWPAPACLVMHRHWRDARRERPGRHAATRPTYGLPFVIDHVFVRGSVGVSSYEVADRGGSDHRAVICDLNVAHGPGL